MPFNRDLIETGCALKTFDGDLSVLERAIDFTVKTSPISPRKSETAVVAPVSNNFSLVAACVPREKRHVKDVVYGNNLDELPSTPVQEVQAASLMSKQVVEIPVVSGCSHVSKQVVEIPVVSGFCFRHIVEETATITSTLQSVCNTPASQPIPATRSTNTFVQPESAEAIRVSRSVKDVVYGETDFNMPCGQSSQVKKEEKQEQPQIAATHFKSCMREEFPADAAPHTRIAVKALMSEVTQHTHWRSAIHGF
jgi:hypothetical protein